MKIIIAILWFLALSLVESMVLTGLYLHKDVFVCVVLMLSVMVAGTILRPWNPRY